MRKMSEQYEIREVELPDGSHRSVRMSNSLWRDYEFLCEYDQHPPAKFAAFAEEEVALQNISFDEAYCCVVGYLANQWKHFFDQMESLAGELEGLGTDEETLRTITNDFTNLLEARRQRGA